ncbi:MAG TPA: DUF885 domain-containing protein [candidate division Zixibacteria bacterium]|nr:DUF885 domain-containing protein [candidate division Zixibacteria bacterium]
MIFSRTLRTILLATVILATAGSLRAASQTAKFQQLCSDVLESLQEFYPVHSTEMGIHTYDNRLGDYSRKSVGNMIHKLTNYEKKLYKYKRASLSLHDRIDYDLIKSNVDITLQDLKQIEWYRKSPQMYVDEAVNGIYFLMLSNSSPLSSRVEMIIDRMQEVPELFKTARDNIKDPPPVYIDAAKESLTSGMQFYKELAGELMNKFPERADELLKVSTQAREAMNDFLTYLTELTPGDPGSFAIGKKNFDYMLSNEYFLDFDSDSLLNLGLQLFSDADQAYKDYQDYIANNPPTTDSIFVPAVFTKQDILDYYNWEVNQEKTFLDVNNILTIPDDIAPVTVVETPPFLRSMIAGIAYQPAGPFDSVQNAYFYVRPIPDNLDRPQLEARYRYVYRRGFKGSVVHEGYPGHHLQMQLAGRNPDPVRKWQTNTMMIEGWALYCEEMMYSNGLYGDEDPAQWLGILGGIRYRAARIIADVKLHTGQFSYDDCVSWMTDALDVTTESGKEYIKTEVRRYTMTPTVQMSYLMGKREIQALYDAASARDGDQFSPQNFYDQLLAEGSIPPELMWQIMGLQRLAEN